MGERRWPLVDDGRLARGGLRQVVGGARGNGGEDGLGLQRRDVRRVPRRLGTRD